MKSKATFLILAILVIYGFVLRFYGLQNVYPFWIDEFSSGQFGAAIARTGSPETVTGFIEERNLLNHYLIGFSMKILGINEFAARIPSAIFGTILIAVVYLVVRKFFNSKIALASSILTTFSVMEITWSRQARSYSLYQVLYLLYLYFFIVTVVKVQQGKKAIKSFIILAVVAVFALLSHLLSIAVFVGSLIYVLLFCRKSLKNIFKLMALKKKVVYFSLFFTLSFVLWWSGLNSIASSIISGSLGNSLHNNIWYYHSFLWRQYSLLAFGAFLGVLITFLKKRFDQFLLLLVLLTHLIVVTFFIPWLDSRYLFPVFPIFVFAYFSQFLDYFVSTILSNKNIAVGTFFFLILIIVFNGHKFTFRPRSFYSPNSDMREIPLADYNQFYSYIKSNISDGELPVVADTWGDRLAWYLGRGYEKAYWFRDEKSINPVTVDGVKKDRVFSFGAITNLKDIKELVGKEKKGFILLDGHEIPYVSSEALKYIENNLNLVMSSDRFYLDPDPYDTWPVRLYSWGEQ